jgi:DUF4097 and DUF4098 domain-containing protein YvlB
VTVTGEDRSDIEVEPDRRAELSEDGRVLEVRSQNTALDIRVPVGMNVSVGSVSGSVSLQGRLGTVRVSTVSGSVEVGEAAGVDVRSISGSISVERCASDCRLNTKSGRINVGYTEGGVEAHTISGGIEVGTAGKGDVSIKSVSGRVRVEVDPGRHPRPKLRTLSGRTACDCPQGNDFSINAGTISGSIEVAER